MSFDGVIRWNNVFNGLKNLKPMFQFINKLLENLFAPHM